MTEHKELAGRLRVYVESPLFPDHAMIDKSLLREAADVLERLSPPEGELTRYATVPLDDGRDVMDRHPYGEWVRYEDVTALLATKEAALVEANARADANLASYEIAARNGRKAEAANERRAAALEKIACRHVTIAPLWWQVEARAALTPDAGEGR